LKKKMQPHIMCGVGDVAKYVLLPGDPKRSKIVAEKFDEYRLVADFREFITYTGTVSGIPISTTSTGIGGNAASIAVEELANIGAKILIRVGTTGALQPDIDVGDLIIPTGAVRREGTTHAYVPPDFPAVPDLDVVNALIEAAETLGVKYYRGIVATSPAYYAEMQYVDEWRKARVLSVEGECSAIFIVSHLRGLKAGAILAVDGNLVKGTKKLEFEPGQELGDHIEIVKKAIDTEIKVAIEAIKILHEKGF